ncbi:glycosyltransferase [Aquabacter cavernae]|uniref:glycosyltransferase n=1 Tax=Aquabacter cavernae TaxID=2496029 RepID=UPI0013E06EE5|nr:glycosyltransferase family 2 protein [Aquabacter cavernae]
MMKLDVICATYNRADLLRNALASLAAARVPPGLAVRAVVVDNNSGDHTRRTVEAFAAQAPWPVLYLFEQRQGRHHALNCGIAASDADLIAHFDDDEVVDGEWLAVMAATFADPAVDYMGGPAFPIWRAPPPDWLPTGAYTGVLGIVDNGPVRRAYGTPGFEGMLTGANCAFRKPILDACGPYSDAFMYAEDRYLWGRLKEIGARGWWVPELIVHAEVPQKRLTRDYYRRWSVQEGRNLGKMAKGQAGLLLGAPRWKWRAAVQNAAIVTMGALFGSGSPSRRFHAELDLRQFAAYFAARNLPFLPEGYYDRA